MIKVKDIECEVDVVIKRSNKNIYLRVKDDRIYITTPHKLTNLYIENLVLKNYDYIYKLLNKPKITSNKIHFLGKSYKVEVLSTTHNNVLVQDEIITIFTRKNDEAYIKKVLHSFYAMELKKIVNKYINDIKKAFNINFDIEFQYKNVKTYFGECFHKRKQVILATKLAKYDLILILSVIYHELAHFYYQNHGSEFYKLLEKVFPEYKLYQKELKKIRYNDMF